MDWLPSDIQNLSEPALRSVAVRFAGVIEEFQATIVDLENSLSAKQEELKRSQIKIEKLSHEMAILKRFRYGARSESDTEHQYGLLDELRDEDIAEVEVELNALTGQQGQPPPTKRKAKRMPLPAELDRIEIIHDPESTHCQCGCQLIRIGEDTSEKLDYISGTFQVERHIRSKWTCRACETIIQKPIDPHVIDGGIPTNNLLAHILTAKYADHLPLYRQRQMFKRDGVDLPVSTLVDWVGKCGFELQPVVDAWRDLLFQEAVLHADETPIKTLSPGNGKTKKSYLWAYATTRFSPIQGVVFDFQPTRAGEVSRRFLNGWQGSLVCDDYGGYKAGFTEGITEIGCWAHARRKFHELVDSSDSPIGKQAMGYIQALYQIEAQAREWSPLRRQRIRAQQALPILEKLHIWLIGQREQLVDSQQTAKAIDYTLKRWDALIRYVEDGNIPIDNNWVENQIRPWAVGRNNWLFAGSVRAGQRAANIMTLVQSAKINDVDPQAYLRDVLEQLPTAKRSGLQNLLPHNSKTAKEP